MNYLQIFCLFPFLLYYSDNHKTCKCAENRYMEYIIKSEMNRNVHQGFKSKTFNIKFTKVLYGIILCYIIKRMI